MNIKLCAHVKLHNFVSLFLRNFFYGELAYTFGEKQNYFRDLGSIGKILLGSRGNYFKGFGNINALFSGIKGAHTSLGASSMHGWSMHISK